MSDEIIICVVCGKFMYNAFKLRRYCSDKCRNKANHKRRYTKKPLYERECLTCDKLFKPIKTYQKYCSLKCKYKAKDEKKKRETIRRNKKLLKAKKCPACKGTFIPTSITKKYCSSACRHWYTKLLRKGLSQNQIKDRINKRSELYNNYKICFDCSKRFIPENSEQYLCKDCQDINVCIICGKEIPDNKTIHRECLSKINFKVEEDCIY